MISIITEITRRKLFRYASSDICWYKRLLIWQLFMSKVYVLYFVWFLHAHLISDSAQGRIQDLWLWGA